MLCTYSLYSASERWTHWNCCACCHGNVQEGSWEVHSSLKSHTATYWQKNAIAPHADISFVNENKSLVFDVILAEHCEAFMNSILFGAQDTGISVRKRVIKILRDICLEQPTFSKITEMCVRMIRRVNDEEGIKVWNNCTFCLLTILVVLTHDFHSFIISILFISHSSCNLQLQYIHH